MMSLEFEGGRGGQDDIQLLFHLDFVKDLLHHPVMASPTERTARFQASAGDSVKFQPVVTPLWQFLSLPLKNEVFPEHPLKCVFFFS